MTRRGRGLLAVLAAAVVAAPVAHADGVSSAAPSSTAPAGIEGPFHVAGGDEMEKMDTGTGPSMQHNEEESESDSRSWIYWVVFAVGAGALAGVAAYVLKLRQKDDPRLPAGEVW